MAADDPLKERFEIFRKRAKQAATTATQREKEGLSRRFAQIGQVGSGAQIRAEAQAGERGAKRLAQAEESVGLAELGERQRLQEVKEARQFARGEREAGQMFAAEQAGLGRQFARGERLGSQAFAGKQADIQRKFARGERLSAQDFASLEAIAGRKFSKSERLSAQRFADKQAKKARIFTAKQNRLMRTMQNKALTLQRDAFEEGVRQFDDTFARDTETIEFNKKMAEEMANKDLFDDLGLSGLFDGISEGFSDLFGGVSTEGLLKGLGIDISNPFGTGGGGGGGGFSFPSVSVSNPFSGGGGIF